MGSPTRRRTIFTFIAGAAAWPLSVTAQQQKQKRPLIGFLSNPSREVLTEGLLLPAFHRGLATLATSKGRMSQLAFSNYVEMGVGGLVVTADALFFSRYKEIIALAACHAIPAIYEWRHMALVGGLTSYGSSGLALLSSAVPKLVNVVFVSSEGGWTGAGGQAVRDAAQKLGISLVRGTVSSPYGEAEFRSAFSSLQRDQLDGLIFSDEGQVHLPQRSLLVQLIRQMRLPAIYPYRDFVEIGGLMAYASDVKANLQRQAAQIVEILRGANPGDIPYSQAVRFELVVNLKTAKELGIEMPAGLVAGAAAVIE